MSVYSGVVEDVFDGIKKGLITGVCIGVVMIIAVCAYELSVKKPYCVQCDTELTGEENYCPRCGYHTDSVNKYNWFERHNK